MKRVLPLLLLVALAAGCGGGDDGDDRAEVEQVIRDYVKAGNDRDGDKYCGDLVTDEYVAQLTGATGNNAREQCRDLLKATLEGLTIKFIRTESVRVEGDRAKAVVVIEAAGRRNEQPFTLVKQDGEFRISSAADE